MAMLIIACVQSGRSYSNGAGDIFCQRYILPRESLLALGLAQVLLECRCIADRSGRQLRKFCGKKVELAGVSRLLRSPCDMWLTNESRPPAPLGNRSDHHRLGHRFELVIHVQIILPHVTNSHFVHATLKGTNSQFKFPITFQPTWRRILNMQERRNFYHPFYDNILREIRK